MRSRRQTFTLATLLSQFSSAVRSWSAAAMALGIWASPAMAQPSYPITDIGLPPGFDYGLWAGPFSEHAVAGDLMYFFQDDGIHGRELWRTDGTPLGTFMIRDLCPGSCGSRYSLIEVMAPLGDRLLFSANDGVHGLELWVTDGTAVGTNLVADIQPGFFSSQIRAMEPAAGQVYLVAESVEGQGALWRSDGTPKGTYGIRPPGSGTHFAPTSIHEGPGFLYLCNATWEGQRGLWRSDGTSRGTSFLAPVECFQNSLEKRATQTVGPDGVLYFWGRIPTPGPWDPELWRSDGTPAGTYVVKALDEGSLSPFMFAWRGDELIFLGESSLWRSDGTEAGTVPIPLADGARPTLGFGSWAVAGNRYFFAAFDPVFGAEPWVYDGVSATRIADLAPGEASSVAGSSLFTDFPLFEPFGDDVLFTANDGIWGIELWRSDGTAGGTVRISDMAPGSAGIQLQTFWPLFPSSLDGRLTFAAYRSSVGEQLWRVNAAGSSVDLIRSLDEQASLFEPRGSDRYSLFETQRGRICFEAVGDRLYFERQRVVGTAPPEFDLLLTDGTPSSVDEILHGSPTTQGECAAQGDQLIYPRGITDSEYFDLLAITTTSEQIEILLTPTPFLGGTPAFFPFGGSQVFLLDSELWISDATVEGTSLLATLGSDVTGALESFRGEMVVLGNSLWMTDASEPAGARELLRSEYPNLGTEFQMAALEEVLLFAASDPDHGIELWSSDGTVEGTSRLTDANPGPASLLRGVGIDNYAEFADRRLVRAGQVAIFEGLDPIHGAELWVTDGTAPGTHLLKDIYPGPYPSTPRELTRFGSRTFFTAESEAEGLELWATDGTVRGTTLLKDIAPGAASSVPDDLVVRDGVLYFSAWSPDHGREAWMSDGTSAGTVRITDIAPGPASSSPQRFARAGNKLFFSATDQIHGYELWAIAYPDGSPLFLDGFEIGSALRWTDSEP
jgi:ELWxxDGT repeat protein